MKRLVMMLAVLALVSGIGSTALAAAKSAGPGNMEIDGSFAFATGPGDFGSGYGFNFGAGMMLPAIDSNLQVRADLSYFDFSYTPGFYLNDLTYTRIPLTVSARYYFPLNQQLKLFAQAGLETSFDQYDYIVPWYWYGVKQSKSEVNIGITPGGGIEFFINPQVSLFAVARIHIISDSYFNMQFGVAAHF